MERKQNIVEAALCIAGIALGFDLVLNLIPIGGMFSFTSNKCCCVYKNTRSPSFNIILPHRQRQIRDGFLEKLQERQSFLLISIMVSNIQYPKETSVSFISDS